MVITPTQVTIYSNITASVGTIISSGLIPIVQERINMISNNYFVSDYIYVDCSAVFNATARSIVIDQTDWEGFGFQANDEIYIYGSYRNDQYVQILSLSSATAILTTAYSVINETFNNSSGAIIRFSLVKWPLPVVQCAAKMIAYDYDVRDKVAGNIRSKSLGPWSESYTSGQEDIFGYPTKITNVLSDYTIARLN